MASYVLRQINLRKHGIHFDTDNYIRQFVTILSLNKTRELKERNHSLYNARNAVLFFGHVLRAHFLSYRKESVTVKHQNEGLADKIKILRAKNSTKGLNYERF